MASFIAIMKWDAGFRVEKTASFRIESDANDHVRSNLARFPDAFVVQDPPGQASDLIANPVAKTVTLSPLPAPTPPTNAELLDRKMNGDKAFRGLLRVVGNQHAITEAAMRALVEAEMN